MHKKKFLVDILTTDIWLMFCRSRHCSILRLWERPGELILQTVWFIMLLYFECVWKFCFTSLCVLCPRALVSSYLCVLQCSVQMGVDLSCCCSGWNMCPGKLYQANPALLWPTQVSCYIFVTWLILTRCILKDSLFCTSWNMTKI